MEGRKYLIWRSSCNFEYSSQGSLHEEVTSLENRICRMEGFPRRVSEVGTELACSRKRRRPQRIARSVGPSVLPSRPWYKCVTDGAPTSSELRSNGSWGPCQEEAPAGYDGKSLWSMLERSWVRCLLQ